ncbi:competence type IV pilus minor pilin ComGD [Neobacillus cucumis]|uniref:Competence protein ComG n=1 Tax=Neobacillus cucumis TaxID=1740721 RepID=A0A2N5H8B0_9BACI|nr:competence type IV pilus minor pilin ComGD [Neobacillus cucumis]PLS01745.1 competence protein ComG [Neobacillus cucumis]
MNRNQKGFTLIESLLVLSIFIVISSITVFSLQPQHSVLEDENFISQLSADLLYAQQYAIAHQDEVSVMFMSNQFKYYMVPKADSQPIVERDYSTNISLTEGSLPLAFRFLPDGNINKFGSFFIQTKIKQYRLTFLIGKGRFYVTEQ